MPQRAPERLSESLQESLIEWWYTRTSRKNTYQQKADELGISVGTLASRIHRIRARLERKRTRRERFRPTPELSP